jgi:HSP20 family protein
MEQGTFEKTPDKAPLNEDAIHVSRKPFEETRQSREPVRPFSLDSIITPIEETIERTVNKFMNRGWLRSSRDERNTWRDSFEPLSPFDGFTMRWPKIDVVDQENEVVVRAELPGVNREDLDVSLSENMLTLRGQTRREERVEKDNYFRSEISQGSFMRSVYLPVEVDGDNATAVLKDGILEVKLPKAANSKRKSIPVL